MRHGTGHVGDAVIRRVVHTEGGVGVRRGTGALEAATLVDGDVDEHRAGLHLAHHLVGDELGRLGPRDEDGPDDEVGLEHLLADRQRGRGDLVDAIVIAPEAHPQLVEIGVEKCHIGAHAEGDVGGVLARDAGTEHDDLGVGDPSNAAEQDAAAASGSHEGEGTHLGREAAGDLRHRVEQGKHATGQLHGLIRDSRDLGRHEFAGERLIGSEVEIGEEEQVLPQPVILLRDRLLHLHDHVGLTPHLVGGIDHGGALGDVVLVADRRADTGILLDEDVVAVGHQFVDPDRRDADAIFVVLDLSGDTDPHDSSSLTRVSVATGWSHRGAPVGGRGHSSEDEILRT